MLLVLVLLPVAWSVAARGEQDAAVALAPVNRERAARALPPLRHDARLDALAARYLDAILARRCVCTPVGGAAASDLAGDVSAALGLDDADTLHAGLVVAYNVGEQNAVTTAAVNGANAHVLRDARMSSAGLATATVPPDGSWLAPPVGGVGPAVDLAGYVLVVIVTAGVGP